MNPRKMILLIVSTIICFAFIVFVSYFDGLNIISNIFNGINRKGFFKKEVVYTNEYSIDYEDYSYYKSSKITFYKKGKLEYYYKETNTKDNQINENLSNGTYKIKNNIMEIKYNDLTSYIYFYDDYLAMDENNNVLIYVKENIVASNKSSTEIVGYYFPLINIHNNSMPSETFTGKKNSTAYYQEIYANATLSNIKKNLYSDQIVSGYDSSNIGYITIKVLINKEKYDVILYIEE